MERVLTKTAAWKRFLPYGLLVALAAIAYLPLVKNLGFYTDDWYLLFAGYTQGPAKFLQVYAVDRPARGPFMALLYTLLGSRVVLYSFTAYLYRLAGALGLFWLARGLWPRQRTAALWMALLLIIYPGFLEQPNAFEFQSQILTAALTVLSVALTAQALRTAKRSRAILWTALALLSFLAGLALMEYYIGLEGLRLAVIVCLTLRQGKDSWGHRAGQIIKRWLPYLLLIAAFMFWRLVIFQNQRAATDITAMVAGLAGSPLQRGLWALMYLLQDLLNVIVFAWVVPAYTLAFRMRLRDLLIGGGLAALSASLVLLISWAQRQFRQNAGEDEESRRWQWEALWIGMFAVAAALAPVILGDRHVVFSAYSRFALPGAAGAVLVIVAGLYELRDTRFRLALLALLVGLATLVHYANAQKFAEEWDAVRNFWWQVSWRAPQIEPGTTLIGYYPVGAAPEDYHVWSPANLIYYPEKSNESPTPVRLPAAVLSRETVQYVMGGSHTDKLNRRSLLSERDFGRVLVLSMPTQDSCMHILNGQQPELSSQEDERILLIAPYSRLDTVMTGGSEKIPPAAIFGLQPPQDWCYIYEKADLARQRGDWQEVARLGDQAIAAKKHPKDWVEWMPFVQAYAYLGQEDKVRSLAPILRDQPYLKDQTCRLFKSGEKNVAEAYRAGQKYLVEQFCP